MLSKPSRRQRAQTLDSRESGWASPYLTGFLVSLPPTPIPLWQRRLFKWLFEASRQKGQVLLVTVGSSKQRWPTLDGLQLLPLSSLCWSLLCCQNNSLECKAIDSMPGHLKTFWPCTPRIPAISRVFQTYTGYFTESGSEKSTSGWRYDLQWETKC